MTLPYDVARCTSTECPMRKTCLRPIQIEKDKADPNATRCVYFNPYREGEHCSEYKHAEGIE